MAAPTRRGTPVRLAPQDHAELARAVRQLSAAADRTLTMTEVVGASLRLAQRYPIELLAELAAPPEGASDD